jgi:SAM-dependent methyltransferase
MTTQSEWQAEVGRTWAETYRETDRLFSGLTQRLLAAIAPLPGITVLDVGCGAGELSLALARARPQAQIIGLDISADLVAAAQDRARDRQQLTFIEADAASWENPHIAPDLLVSRHDVMFFADPVAAFVQLRATAAPGANLIFSCFRSPRENPWASELTAMLPASPAASPPDPDAPGPFAFADEARVRAILAKAGWSQIAFEACDFAYIAGQGDDAVADAANFFTRIGPAAQSLRQLPEAERSLLSVKIEAWLQAHHSAKLVAFPAAAWIVSARSD